jgi:hypothetical protein
MYFGLSEFNLQMGPITELKTDLAQFDLNNEIFPDVRASSMLNGLINKLILRHSEWICRQLIVLFKTFHGNWA